MRISCSDTGRWKVLPDEKVASAWRTTLNLFLSLSLFGERDETTSLAPLLSSTIFEDVWPFGTLSIGNLVVEVQGDLSAEGLDVGRAAIY